MVVQGGRDVGVAVAGGVVDGHGKLQLQPTSKKVEEAAVVWNDNTVTAQALGEKRAVLLWHQQERKIYK